MANNLHFAAAIAFILMVILLIGMALMQRYANSRADAVVVKAPSPAGVPAEGDLPAA